MIPIWTHSTLLLALLLQGCVHFVPDWNVRPIGLRQPAPREFRVWTAPRWEGAPDSEKGCNVVFFALVTGIDPVRLNALGKEQNLGTSWTFEERVGANESLSMEFWFIDPVTGETLRYVKESFRCKEPSAPFRPYHHRW